MRGLNALSMDSRISMSCQVGIRCLTFLSSRRTWKIKSNVIYVVHFIQRQHQWFTEKNKLHDRAHIMHAKHDVKKKCLCESFLLLNESADHLLPWAPFGGGLTLELMGGQAKVNLSFHQVTSSLEWIGEGTRHLLANTNCTFNSHLGLRRRCFHAVLLQTYRGKLF